MSEKKNIDRLFREQFKEFEETPPEFIWQNIEDELRQKKKRRVVPFWIKLSGVAAVLIVGYMLMLPYFNNGTGTPVNPVVLDQNGAGNTAPDKGTGTGGKINGIDQKGAVKPDANSAVVSNEAAGPSAADAFDAADGASGSGVQQTGKNGKTGIKQNEVTAAPATGVAGTAKQKNTTKRNTAGNGSNTAVAVSGKNKKTNTASGKVKTAGGATTVVPSGHNNAVANNSANPGKNKQQHELNTANDVQKNNVPQNNGLATNAATGKNATVGEFDVNNSTGAEKTTIIDKDIPVNEAVAETAIDTAAAQPENELEKLLREKEKEKEDKKEELAENTQRQKWNIKPQLAPVFYNSLSQGSPIGEDFAANSKSFENDLSYGVGVNYALNDRLTIRSGVNTVNLNYSTGDVAFYASLDNTSDNLAKSAGASSANIVVESLAAPPNGGLNSPTAAFSSTEKFSGSMLQKTGYIEVPVEMSYALLNKKFGIELIGGVSTLFLNQNNVSVITQQGLSANVGEAQNLNNVHFSTNVGVGFKYKFFKSFEASFEPMFKYQVNTFSRDAGNFKPYFIGLYSGVSFSF
jgi:hypothetical protein